MTDIEALIVAIRVLKFEWICTSHDIRHGVGNIEHKQSKLIEVGETISQLERLRDRLRPLVITNYEPPKPTYTYCGKCGQVYYGEHNCPNYVVNRISEKILEEVKEIRKMLEDAKK